MLKMNKQYKKTAPKVKDGIVQKKNNWNETPTYWNTRQHIPIIDKEPAGEGFKHFLRKKDIFDFIDILPNWDELSRGLGAILLAPGGDADGWISSGVVAVCAWPKDMWINTTPQYFHEHKQVFERLGVPWEKCGKLYQCKFAGDTIRGFLLLHILLHEFGHHHDRMTTKNKVNVSRGESYAEQYALKYEARIWDEYLKKFRL